MSDAAFDSILRGARANSRWAWERIYDEHAPRVLQFARVQGAQDPDAIVGEVFVRVVRSLHTFNGSADDFRGWVYRIAQNCVRDAGRAAASDPVPMEQAPEGESPDTADIVDQRDAERRLVRMLGAPPPDQRSVIYLRVVLDMSLREVADVLETSVPAVKMLQQRGMKTLRERTFFTDST